MKSHRRYRSILVCGRIFLICILTLLAGCAEQSGEPEGTHRAVQRADYNGFSIPLFSTATAQFNYAKSLLANPEVKAAALRVLIERFPENRREMGEARLELAYMQLGDDFRLADHAACRRALKDYAAIAGEFSDLPAVFTKALWYRGWIHADLLDEKEKGIAIYSDLAEKYPGHSFSRISPVPWLDLIFPNPRTEPYTADDRHTHSWAGLALSEIVRLADDNTRRTAAFEKLWREHRGNLATGYALREILKRSDSPGELSQKIFTFIELNTVNPALNRDLVSHLAGHPAGRVERSR